MILIITSHVIIRELLAIDSAMKPRTVLSVIWCVVYLTIEGESKMTSCSLEVQLRVLHLGPSHLPPLSAVDQTSVRARYTGPYMVLNVLLLSI